MIYIAAPYNDNDKRVVEYRIEIVCKYAAFLMKNGFDVISPLIHGTGILRYADLPTNTEFWLQLSKQYFLRSDRMHVLCFPGWIESKGVGYELELAYSNFNYGITYIPINNDLLKRIK